MVSIFKFRLRYAIPLLVFLFFALTAVVFSFRQFVETERDVDRYVRNTLTLEMYKLQNSLNDLFGLSLNDLAAKRMAELYLDTQLKLFVLADDSGKIIFTNKNELKNTSTCGLARFDTRIAEQVKQHNSNYLLAVESGKYNGYYSIGLKLMEGELRRQHMGVIYFEYDYVQQIDAATHKAMAEQVWYGLVVLLFAFLLSYFLYWSITSRVEGIASAMNSMADGAYDTRLNLKKRNDELSILASGFNRMADQIDSKSKQMQLMQFVMDHSSDSIFLITKDGDIEYVNESACKSRGYQNSEFLIMKVGDLDADYAGDVWPQHWQELKKHKHLRFETTHRTKSNQRITVEVSANYMQFGDREYNCAIVRDVTDREAAKQQLLLQNAEFLAFNEEYKAQNEQLRLAREQAEESDRLKTAFLQNMSHEIRTPMNAIVGFADLLKAPSISDAKRQSFVSIINNSSQQLLAIISDILTISSLEINKEKLIESDLSINNALVELFAIFMPQATKKGLHLFLNKPLADQDSVIKTDKTKFIQVISNLLTNALKFTHQGSVTFGYKLLSSEGQANIVFYVKDTGIGIGEEAKERIFERFRQADSSVHQNFGGTGLGLAISKGFAELMGGKVWVESEPGKGATFYFSMPYKPLSQSSETAQYPSVSRGPKTVLVAEDEELNFLYLEELLSPYHVAIVHVSNGLDAVTACRDNPAICIVLMDIKMPMLDGYSAAKEIKQFRPELPIFAQSAYALDHEIEKYKEVFDEYLTKPIDQELFHQQFAQVLANV